LKCGIMQLLIGCRTASCSRGGRGTPFHAVRNDQSGMAMS
jgi:hypothetical protein